MPIGAVAHLAISVTARVSKLLAGFKRAGKAVKKFVKRVRVMARAVRTAALSFGLLGIAGYMALKKILGAGEMFNRKMRRSLAIMTGMTMGLRQQMRLTAIEVASKTLFSTQQAAEAYFFLASAGLDAKRSLEALPTVAQFAQAGMFNMARATELLTDAQSALGLTIKNNSQQNMKNMLRVSDVLVKANSIANATTEQFSEALTSRAGSALKMWGKDIEEGVAVLAAFADQGTKAAEAGTAFDIVLRDLTRAGIRAGKQLDRYGVEVYDKTSGKIANLAHIIADLEDAMAGMSDRQKKQMLVDLTFQERSIAHMLKLIGLSPNIVRYESMLRRAGGSTQRIADMQLTPLEKSVAKLEAAWTSLSLSAGPTLTLIAKLIEKVSEAMKGWSEYLQPTYIIEKIKDVFNTLNDFWLKTKTSFHLLVSFMTLELMGFFEAIGMIPGKIGVAFNDIARRLGQFSGRQWTKAFETRKERQNIGAGELKGWGDRMRKVMYAPGLEMAHQIGQAMWEGFKDQFVVKGDQFLFDLTRAMSKPVTTLLKKFGFSKSIASEGGLAAGAGVQHQDISLSRHAVAGVNVDRTGKRVTDQKLDDILGELVEQTGLARRGAIGLTGP